MTIRLREEMIAQVEAMKEELRQGDPLQYAANTGAEFCEGAFRIKFYGEPYLITFPDFQVRVETTGKVCGLNPTGMFLYYLKTADGSPPAGKWIALRELPGGMFYHRAYQGYSGNLLAKAINNQVNVFARAANHLGGLPLALGDAAFAFDALPRVQVAAVYHTAAEGLPASAAVLFDASASHYLPTDLLAGVGSALVDRLTGAEAKDHAR
jgi:hypothetical protein